MSANTGEEGGPEADTNTSNNNSNDDSWTRIVRKNKGRGQHRSTKQPTTNHHHHHHHHHHQQPPAAGPVDNFRPNPAPTLSAADIHAEHAQVTTAWRATTACAQLRALVRANANANKHNHINTPSGSGRSSSKSGCGVRVRRAICLGLGAFDPADGAWVARRRAHVQLAAFLTMVEALTDTEEEEGQGQGQQTGDDMMIECFYQEPRFAQPDKEFISALGGTVVESPASYELVDEGTLVFGVHLYRDIWAAALEKSLPGVFVGTGWDIWEESPGAEKSADFDRIRQMDAGGGFAKFAFPQDEHHSFSSTCIYWKKEKEGVVEE